MLGLSITAHLYPRLEAERYGAGRLTKIRAQTVSGPSCRAVAERLGVPDRLAAAAPAGIGQSASTLVATERVLASVIEAVIGACYLHAGYERDGGGGRRGLHRPRSSTRSTIRWTSSPRCRSAWPSAARSSSYDVTAELGPPHDRTFEVLASVGERPVGTGSGRSKKHAEQEAARTALEMLYSADEDEFEDE